MSMSVDGLISGMDTTSLISQLLAAEAGPQTQLKAKLATAQTQASAYRTVNTTFAAVRAAAEALTTTSLAAARRATASAPSVTASAGTGAADGSSISFTVTSLASRQIELSHGEWSSLSAAVAVDKSGNPAEPDFPLEIRNADGTVRGTVSLDSIPNPTLADAIKAVNDAKLGVTAAAVKVSDGTYRLQIASTATGEANGFQLRSDTERDADGNVGSAFLRTSTAEDATLDLGGGVVARSASNTFADLLGGVSVTVSTIETGPVTVSVTPDTDSVVSKMQTLVDAVNSALTTVKTYTSNAQGSTAALKGDVSLNTLAGQLLSAVSGAVGTDSPALVGLQLTKDGKVTFDKATFAQALKDTPALAQRLTAGSPASLGANGVVGGGDDVPAVEGIAGRLLAVAKTASDNATGSIMTLAKGKDSIAADIKNRVEAWDLRLAKRKETLTRQFTAMETALSGLRNQSTWLAGQINSLPS